ncbi:response regulator [Pelosinus sp. IPA-1]|uniref:response regulator n=1 Tax=Pelosinus sp. IPA-1 TaxID=3029569 RepID=UPI0024361600|nr:response regulator [Pelosinus sp. IPA-1]GMA98945.1 response regulator [Pelosinus sp. IPA-1]
MRILIVDDSRLVRSQLKDFLSSNIASIEIEEAADGKEALEKHRVFKPDAIFLDYIIPAPDGLAVLKTLSETDKKVKVIMTTSLASQNFIYKDCLEYGAVAILQKPIDKENALKIINKHFKLNGYG